MYNIYVVSNNFLFYNTYDFNLHSKCSFITNAYLQVFVSFMNVKDHRRTCFMRWNYLVSNNESRTSKSNSISTRRWAAHHRYKLLHKLPQNTRPTIKTTAWDIVLKTVEWNFSYRQQSDNKDGWVWDDQMSTEKQTTAWDGHLQALVSQAPVSRASRVWWPQWKAARSPNRNARAELWAL